MRLSFGLALLLFSSSITLSAQNDASVTATLPAETKAKEALAIQKTLILATLLQKEESADDSANEQNILTCADFAVRQGAPASFVTLLQESAKAGSQEEGDALAQAFNKILAEYSIDSAKLYVWASICAENPDAVAQWLDGENGSVLLQNELLAADKAYVQQLSPTQFAANSAAIKKSMLMLHFLSISDNNRISVEHLEQVLEQAKKWGAPKMLIRLLAADSSRTIAPNTRYELNTFLSQLFEAYMIDRTALRIYAELCPVDTQEMLTLLKDDGPAQSFFVAPAFNLLPIISESVTTEELDLLSEKWLMDVRGLAEALAHITNENADKADLSAIAAKIPSYFRLQSLQKKHDLDLTERINKLEKNRYRSLLVAIHVTQQQLQRLLNQKEQLPAALQALLTQFI